jgi:hypothetical protein
MVDKRQKPESGPDNWKTVVRPQGPGYGKSAIWEWAIYPEKSAVIPLLRGAVKGAQQKAWDAARAAVKRELKRRAKTTKRPKKKPMKAN